MISNQLCLPSRFVPFV